MKPYYKSSAWKKLRWHRTRSLLHYLRNSALFRQPRSVRRRGNKRLPLLKTTPYSKRYSMVNVKTLPYFVKRVFGLNPRQKEPERNGFWTSVNGVHFQFLSRTMVRKQVAGLLAKARPSTCRISSEARSYAKRLWLPLVTNWSWGTYHRLNRECSRGFRITQTCSTSSGLAVTLTRVRFANV